MGSLEKRYAEALLSLAENADQADIFGAALGVLGKLYLQNAEFRSYILNPVISIHIRSETLLGILDLLGYTKDSDDREGDKAAKKPAVKTVNTKKYIYADTDNSNEPAIADAGVLLLRFLQLLLDKGRFAFLPVIAEEYNNIKAKYRKKLRVIVRSPVPLDPEKLFEISEKYKAQYGSASAETDNIVESSMQGGINVQIGGVRADDTLYGKLAALARAVAGGAVKQKL
jgi:F-type H+-transporting ATPase subunit delta